MLLFQSKQNDLRQTANQPLKIVTPLGNITLLLDAGAGNLLDHHHTCHQFQSGGYIYTWAYEHMRIEMIMSYPVIELPTHMQVDGHCGLLIRFMNLESELSLKCVAYWSEHQWITGGSSTGQYLEASTWEDDHYYVSIGTEDTEALHNRIHANKLMPIAIQEKQELTFSDMNRVGIYLPSIESHHICQFHFYIAWKRYTDPEDVDTWYAVDQQADLILKYEECF